MNVIFSIFVIIFRIVLCIFILSIFFNESLELDLHCKYDDQEWVPTCSFQDITITQEMENQNFTISGLDLEKKQRIYKIMIYSSKISQLPREIFQEFPRLRRIEFHLFQIPKITYGSFEKLMKFQRNIKKIVFVLNEIREIDPRVQELFKKYKSLEFRFQDCLDEFFVEFEPPKGFEKLRNCFDNFLVAFLDSTDAQIQQIKDENSRQKLRN